MVQSALAASQHRIAASFEGGGVMAGGGGRADLGSRLNLGLSVLTAVDVRVKVNKAVDGGIAVKVALGAANVVMAHVEVG